MFGVARKGISRCGGRDGRGKLTTGADRLTSDEAERPLAMERPGKLVSFEHAEFLYEPFPMGVVRPVFADEIYEQLLDRFPAEDFVFKPDLGKKYSLSEVNNPGGFHRQVKPDPLLRQLFREFKSPEFVDDVLRLLKHHGIDLGLPRSSRSRIGHAGHFVGRLLRRQIDVAEFGRHITQRPRRIGLTTRLEFSMLPADGGYIKPHTDAPHKCVTLVFSMARPGEWDPRFGGGTGMLKPRDVTKSYNWLNEQMEPEHVDVLYTFPFEPNQCVIFVKTFNSLHSVEPMTGPADLMRRTLTVNIERAGVL